MSSCLQYLYVGNVTIPTIDLLMVLLMDAGCRGRIEVDHDDDRRGASQQTTLVTVKMESTLLLTVKRTHKFYVLALTVSDDTVGCHPPNKNKKRIFLDIDEPYTRTIIHRCLEQKGFSVTLGPGEGMDAVEMPSDCQFQWSEYERIDWQNPNVAASSYRIRKGLSRKAQFALYTSRYISKHPESLLKQAIPESFIIDTWSVWESSTDSSRQGLADIVTSASCSGSNINQRERLEHCLETAKLTMDAGDEDAVWILKGSTVNKGAGMYIVHVYEQLLDICWSEPDIREWVLQRYISTPLTLRKRKFHIRAYIVAVGALRVFFANDCLALLSGTVYRETDFSQLTAHITNTAFQEIDPKFREEECVLRWGSDQITSMLVRDSTCKNGEEAHFITDQVLQRMRDIVGELFAAYETEFGVFSPIETCFEHYGLDFLIDSNWQVYLLEVNPGPDFKQTGSRLELVIENLMASTIDVALTEASSNDTGYLVCVYDKKRRTREK